MKNNYILKNYWKAIVCIMVISLFGVNQSKADHVMGSDITYKCTSTPGIFEVTFVFYRACSGIPVCPQTCGAPCSRTLQIFGADPGCSTTNYGSVTMSLVSVRDVGANPDCPNAKSTCTNMNCVTAGSYTPALERYEFRGFANIGPTSGIPTTCCNVRFVFAECCRNAEINTGATWQNFYVDAVVNRCHSVSPCNSSPELANDPFAVMCGGENFVFNNGAIDPDFDSLSFNFAPALQGFGNSVTYTPPYRWDRPMPWTGSPTAPFPAGISCDPFSGDIMFTPGNTSGQNFYGIMCVEVRQWKTINGVPTVIGITRRDIQMVVLANCPPNNTPRLTTNPPSLVNPNAPRTNWEVCAGDQLCFTVTAKDTDYIPPLISDTTKLSWNNAIGSLGATFVKNYAHTEAQRRIFGPREDQWRFCWTPTENLASNTPYYFTISAKDKRCPNPGRITRAFSVKVLPKADVLITKTDLRCGKWRVRYDRDPNKPGGKLTVPYTGVTWVIARVPNDFSLSQNPYVFINTATPPDLSFALGGKYLVQLQIATPGPQGMDPCIRIFRDTLDVDTVVAAQFRDTLTCIGSSVQIRATAKYGTPIYTYRWYNSIKDTSGPALNAPNFGVGTLTVNPTADRYYTIQVRDINGCRSYDSLFVDVKALPVSSLLDSMRICNGDTFTFDAGNNGGNVRNFLWTSGDTTQTIAKQDSGQFIVLITDTFGCKMRDTALLFVNRPVTPNAGLDSTLCFGDSIQLRPTGGQQYQWRDLNNNTIVMTKRHDGRYWVKPTNTSLPNRYILTAYVSYPDTTSKYKECFKNDTVQIRVNALPALSRPAASVVCRSTPLTLLPNFTITNGQGGGTGVWTYPPAPLAIAPSGSQLYVDSLKNNPRKDTNTLNPFVNWVRYAYTSPAAFGGCTRVDSAQINMYANPAVNAGSRLNWCTNAGPYKISAPPPALATENRVYSPKATAASGDLEEWIGNGISQTHTTPLRGFSFTPSPAIKGINIINFKYTRNYNNLITCQSEDTVIFNVIEPPTIDAGSDILICKNEPIFNIANFYVTNPVPGRTPATITPNTGAGYWSIVGNADSAIINNNQDFDAKHPNVSLGMSPTVTYIVSYNDTSTGCKVKDDMNLQVARVPNVDLVYDMPSADSIYVCQNTKVVYFRAFDIRANGSRLEIGANGSNSAFEGSTAFGLNTNLAVNTSRLAFNSNNEVPGQYGLKYTFTDISTTANCKGSDTNTIYILQPPTIAITASNEVCSYDTLSDVSVVAGQPTPADMKFRWTPVGDGTYVNDTLATTQYITGSGERNNGAATIQITTTPRNNTNLPGKNAAGVTVVGNAEQCAPATASTSLIINRSPVASILVTNPDGCEPLTTELAADNTGVAGALFNWEWENNTRPNKTDSAITEVQPNYDVNLGGFYKTRLIVSTSSNPPCFDTSEWQIMQVHAKPKPDFATDPEKTTIAKPFFNFENKTQAPDNAALTYRWNLGPGPDPNKPEDRISTEFSPVNIEYAADTARQIVWLTAISEYGCIDSTFRFIRIDPDITVYIPNAFYPGSDVTCPDGDPECNKTFKVSADGYASIEIFVFNRWGQQVFYTIDSKEGWNGKMRKGDKNNEGDICPQDVYIYQVNSTSFNGKKYKYSGSLTLLR